MKIVRDWITGRLVCRAECYDDLRRMVVDEIAAQADLLEDRARSYRIFLENFHTVETPDEIHELGKRCDLLDDFLYFGPRSALWDLIQNWPHVKTAPGEGYW